MVCVVCYCGIGVVVVRVSTTILRIVTFISLILVVILVCVPMSIEKFRSSRAV